MGVKLRPHQTQALAKLSNGKVLRGGVGSGKSLVSMAYYVEREAPKPIYIFTTAKKRDELEWEGEAAKYGIGKEADATTEGVLTVDSWNNIGKYVDVEGAFMIFDEQRLVGSGAWVKSFLKMAKRNRWIMLSATPGDVWVDYIPLFIANGFYKNRTEFIREHVVYKSFTKFPQIDKYLETGKLLALQRKIVVEMPYERHTTRHIRKYEVEYDKDAFRRVLKDRWHIYEERPIRDSAELFALMRKVVNSDADRVRAVQSIFLQHKKLIIFYNFNYELDALREMCENMWVPYAEWNGKKHEKIPDGDSWIYLVQYTAGAEGWNCVTTDTIIFYSLNYSHRLFEQAQGRIDRMNTPFKDLHYYILRSTAPIDRAIWKTLGEKRTFNERLAAANVTIW